MNGRPLKLSVHFEKKGATWLGTLTNTMGNSLPLSDLVITPDRRFSFKVTFPNGMFQTYKGTVDVAYQNLIGTCDTVFGAQTIPGTVNGKRKPQ